MKTSLKIALALLLVVIIAVGSLAVLAKSYLTDEHIRSYLVETAERSLGRKVSMGAIQVSIFKGISFKDFEIREKDGATPFVRAESFVLNYQLLPLLSKSLVIDKLELVNARLRIQKDAEGTYNFSDIGRQPGGDEKKVRPPGSAGLPISLNVRSFSLKNAVVEYAEPSGALRKARILVNADLGITSPSAGLISSEGNFQLTADEAVLRDGRRPLKDLTAHGTYQVHLNIRSRKCEITEFKADVAKIPVMVKGYVSYADPPSFALDLAMPETKLALFQQIAAPFLPAGTILDGSAAIAVSAEKSAGPENRIAVNGQLIMNNAAVSTKGFRPVLSGTIRFSPELISFDKIRLAAGDSSAELSGQVRDYANSPHVRLDLRAASLNIDALAPPGGGHGSEAKESSQGAAPRKEEKEFEPVRTQARAEGSVEIDNVIFRGLPIRNFHAAYSFRDNIFRISSMTGNTLSGSFRVQSTVDLSVRGTTYSMNVDTTGVKLEDITAAFAPKAKDTLYGALFAKADFSGSGTLRETITQNLKGKGTFAVKEGRIKNAKISSGLLAFLGLQDLREIAMDKADGTFTVSDGIVNLSSQISSRDLMLDEKGTIGMDERLNLGVLVKASDRISPKMLGQSSIAQFLSEEKGWTSIPLLVTGTVTKPSYAIDMQAVGKKATQKLQKKVGEELLRSLSGGDKKGRQEQPQTEPAPQKKKESTPQDLLKGIFGR